MSVWAAVAWGGFSSASLYLGEALARPLAGAHRAVGLVMGFGAGTLLSAVAYELVPESTFGDGADIGVGCALGALTYFVGDWLVDHRGAAGRQRIAAPKAATIGAAGAGDDNTADHDTAADGDDDDGAGPAMFLGALLDGLPDSFILGITLAVGGSISVSFLVAVFVSNIPQGIAGTTSLKAAGYSERRITAMWTALTVASAGAAGAGYVLADSVPHQGLMASAFAAGAVLVMLADSMMPEAFRNGGRAVGLATVVGYLVAAALAVAQ